MFLNFWFPSIIPTIYADRYPFPPIIDGIANDSTATDRTNIVSNPSILNLYFLSRYAAARAIYDAAAGSEDDDETIRSVLCSRARSRFPLMTERIIRVSIYAQGSLLPLSISSMDAVEYLG